MAADRIERQLYIYVSKQLQNKVSENPTQLVKQKEAVKNDCLFLFTYFWSAS